MKKLQWGNWHLNSRTLELIYRAGYNQLYEIDLETITSSSQMLDWLLQIKGKAWASNQDITDLLQAFKELFDPQCYLCSFGEDKRIKDVRAHIQKVREWRERPLKCLAQEDSQKVVINTLNPNRHR